MEKLRILIVDDEESIRHMLSILLRKEGYEVSAVADGEQALQSLLAQPWDLVLCDVRMPRLGGLELIDQVVEREISTTVIAMSAFGNRQMAVEALQRGAYDYIDKPFKRDEILLTLAKAEERLQLKRENASLRAGEAHGVFQGLVGSSEPMRALFETLSKVARYKSTVLITGESGTGKELAARSIHALSPRADKPWVAVNCGAIPENLLESELFGHVRGAFTDATHDKLGLFEQAHQGTLFLDEIGEMSLNLQVKLLRVLQEAEVRRVGGTRSIPVDVRVVAATLHDLAARVEQGHFRADLFYRLNVINVRMPPLRERPGDISALVKHFIQQQNKRLGTAITGVSTEAMKIILDYSWPGNVRELQNCIERGVVLANGPKIDASVLPQRLLEGSDELQQLFDRDELSIKKMSADLERILIRRALEKTDGNRTHAAKLLEISHRALLYKIKDYQLETVGMD